MCALMQGKHERLGGESPLRCLPIDICKTVCEVASTYEVATDPALLPDFTSIAQAVRMVPDGSTVSIHDGDYVETAPIIITSRITLCSKSHAAEAAMTRRLRLHQGEAEDAVGADSRGAASVEGACTGLSDSGYGQATTQDMANVGFLLTGIPATLGGLLAIGGGAGVGVGVGGWIGAGDADDEQGDGHVEGQPAASTDSAEGEGGADATEGGETQGATVEQGQPGAGQDSAPTDNSSAEGGDLPQTPQVGAGAAGQHTPHSIGRKKGMPKTAVTVRMFAQGTSRKDPLLLIAAPLAVVNVSGITFLHLCARALHANEAGSGSSAAPEEAEDGTAWGGGGAAAENTTSVSATVNAGSMTGVALPIGEEGEIAEICAHTASGDDRGEASSSTATASEVAACKVQGAGGTGGVSREGSSLSPCASPRTNPRNLAQVLVAVADVSALVAVHGSANDEFGSASKESAAGECGQGSVPSSEVVGLGVGEINTEGAGEVGQHLIGPLVAGGMDTDTAGAAVYIGADTLEGLTGIEAMDGHGWRCVEVLRGVLEMRQCVVRSEQGNGVIVRNSGAALFSHCHVSHCGLHGVSAVHGALVDSYKCKVSWNSLSGYNAVGKGACVRCRQCDVLDNEDGGVNVLQGALALTSGSKLSANRGSGVRAMGQGSWAVQMDCIIALNGWHGVSALEGGCAFIQRTSVTRNLGAGVNAFSAGSASVVDCNMQHNRFGIWAQNAGRVLLQRCLIAPSSEGDETILGGATILHLPDQLDPSLSSAQ